jgi:FtsP/CotA-like multicopper oxidase with cupredoxin domain
VPGTDFPPSDPQTTGQVMKLVVGPRTGEDTSTPPDNLDLPAPKRLGRARKTRRVLLTEENSTVLADVGPIEADLGTLSKVEHEGIPMGWDEPITEKPREGATGIWELHNFTADAHPIHIHEVQFQVLDRQPFGGAKRRAENWERGRKDTVIAYPGEITRVKARFERAGLFVWHCHMLEHEDNEMMRPLRVRRRRRRRKKTKR